jgi:transportin-1
LTQLQRHPEFNNYLAFIMGNTSTGEAAEIRQRAGLMLKNNCAEHWDDMLIIVRQYVKSAALATFGDANPFIRQTVGSLITTIAAFQTDGSALGAELEAWPQLLPRLIQALEQGAPAELVDGALNAVSKLCEDLPAELDSDALGRPLNALLPQLLKYFRSEHEPFRRYAVGSMNQFLLCMPNAMNVVMEQYLQGLFTLASGDPSKEVRRRVCQAFVLLIDHRFHVLAPFMRDIIRFMLYCTQSDDEALALDACEFWSSYCGADGADLEMLRSSLPELIPVLMKNMVYSEMDLAMMPDIEEDNQNVPDMPHQVRPAHYHGRVMGGDGDDEDDDDESATEWSLRKCSAASLDSLAVAYGPQILQFVLPELDRRLADVNAPWPQVCS